MAETSNRFRIQSALTAAAKNATFPRVSYGLAGPREESPVEASAHANEIGARWDEDPDYRRGRRLRREEWLFALYLEFSCEVLLEGFERSLLEPIQLPATDGLNQITLLLRSVEVIHPTEDGEQGTHAQYTFLAEVGRD